MLKSLGGNAVTDIKLANTAGLTPGRTRLNKDVTCKRMGYGIGTAMFRQKYTLIYVLQINTCSLMNISFNKSDKWHCGHHTPNCNK